MTVVVVHPQVQHVHEVVRALSDGGLLERFYTSICYDPGRLNWLPNSLRTLAGRRWSPPLPADKVKNISLFEVLWRGARQILGDRLGERAFYYNVWSFDHAVARHIGMCDAKIIVGYENSSRDIFREGKKSGKYCVLDAASVHYQTQRAFYSPPYSDKFLDKINLRKEEEIRLADHILTLSSYARQTYIDAGVPEGKVSIIPLGVDLSKFPEKTTRVERRAFRFLFVGNRKLSKGLDILLEAFTEAAIPQKELVIVGAAGDADHLLKNLPGNVCVMGHLPHALLQKEYKAADVFVLPSKLDGFGLVVAEAMATGTPVIVSSHVGAKDLVKEDVNGWIFESGNTYSLAAAMLHAWGMREEIDKMGVRARAQVQRYTWEHYRAAIREYYRLVLSRL